MLKLKNIYSFLFSILLFFPRELNPAIANESNRTGDKQTGPEHAELLASVINSESESENYLDKLLVGSTVLNRMRKENKTMLHVIYEKNMFSGIHGKHFRVTDESLAAATFLIEHGPIDTTIIYFINPKIATDKSWLEIVMTRPLVVQNTNHFFYK